MIRSQWVKNYIGIPYRERGRSISGADCWGLARLVYEKELGAILPMFDGVDKEYDARFTRVRTPREFDLAYFDCFPARSHVGVVLLPTTWMLHSHPIAGVTAININRQGKSAPDFYRWKN